jgi:hypothetical protein
MLPQEKSRLHRLQVLQLYNSSHNAANPANFSYVHLINDFEGTEFKNSTATAPDHEKGNEQLFARRGHIVTTNARNSLREQAFVVGKRMGAPQIIVQNIYFERWQNIKPFQNHLKTT